MAQDFVEVAIASDLPAGRMKCIAIGGRRLLLANVDGRFWATDDTCTHEDASLSTGVLKGGLVRCPLHGSRFNVCTGEVLEEPSELNLRTYRVRVEGDRVLVAVARHDAA